VLGDEPDLTAAERWVDDWQTGIEERAAQAQALARRVGQLSATVHSRGDVVGVTVDSSGAMTALRLDDNACRHPAAWIAEQILATVRAAQAELVRQVTEATTQTVGLESEIGRAMVASFTRRLPPPEDGGGDAG